ncbi:MAG: hypothetical protein COC05_00960 [Gammaproteobacteria bacterium]|nr:MAG: hypothetical protein COC05_00960 [Gammaproteobacteria bacterium]
MEWNVQGNKAFLSDLESKFAPLTWEVDAEWSLKDKDGKLRVAIFVSKYDHYLREILWRYDAGELPVKVAAIVSNHKNKNEVRKTNSLAASQGERSEGE